MPNKYSPDKLQKIALSLMGGMVMMTFVLTNLQALLWQSSNWLVGSVLPAVVVQLTNEERSDLNASPLKRSSTLDAAAKLKAEHMAKNQYFAHYAPDGTTPWYWFDVSGYKYAHAGENLAIHFTDSDQVVEAWMNSPAHRDNIVSGKFTEIGVGTAKGRYQGSDTVYVVQLFGAPAALPIPPPAAPTPVVAAEPAPVPEQIAVVDSSPTVAAAEVDNETPVIPTEVPAAESEAEAIVIEESEASLVQEEAPVSTAPEAVPVDTAATADLPEPSQLNQPITVAEFSSPILQSMISTSSGLPVAESEVAVEQQSTSFLSLATQPNTVMQIAYTLIALAVFLLLILSFVNEMRHAHPIQMAYSLSLLLMMGGLYWLHTSLTSGAIIV